MAAVSLGMYPAVQATIAAVDSRHLLPRWDLATHLAHGWIDYDFLTTGRLHRFAWDLWEQGYWPPGLSVFQLPFFIASGGDIEGSLWSSVVAFLLVAAVGAATLCRVHGDRAIVSAAVFAMLLLSSPYLLAYATVTMTEMLGALAQLVVLWRYVVHQQAQTERSARLFALSLTALFFVKYNYFVLLAIPLAIHHFLEQTRTWPAARRVRIMRSAVAAAFASPTGRLLALYVIFVLIVVGSGGFEFRIFGQRISMRSIGSSGHIVLYLLLARTMYLHWRGRIDWDRLFVLDPLVRPLLIWLVAPVVIWLASPYPNHLRDVANLVINRSMGQTSVETGLSSYLDALRSSYFVSDWVFAVVVTAFGLAVWRYRDQPGLMRLLIIAVPVQLVAVLLHQTRFTRFLLLTVVLLCLAAAIEIGHWVSLRLRRRAYCALAGGVLLGLGVMTPRVIVNGDRFRFLAFEHYTESQALDNALQAIRAELSPADRLVVAGQSNELSPALFRLELGPPSGGHCFPFEIAGADRLDLGFATHVLLIAPRPGIAPRDPLDHQPGRLQEVSEAVAKGEFVLQQEFVLEDLRVRLQLYRRPVAPVLTTRCR